MDDTKELILRAHNGDKAARDKLVLENIGWCTVCPGVLPEEVMSLRILIR